MDQFKEAPNNPFDAPIPGQSLTDKPGNAPWEHPPQFTNTSEAADFVFDQLSDPQMAKQVIAMLDAGIPVEAIGRIIVFAGFTEGKWTPDVAFIIAEPIMKMIAYIGSQGGVEKFRISMQDLTNNKAMKSIIEIKNNKEELEKVAKGTVKEIKKIESRGLMAQPQPTQQEIM